MEHPLKRYRNLEFIPFIIRHKNITPKLEYVLRNDFKKYVRVDSNFNKYYSFNLGDVVFDYLSDQKYFKYINCIKVKDILDNPGKYFTIYNTLSNNRFYFKKQMYE